MESETTKETLVRKVRVGAPDGTGVMQTEKLEVEVTWPNGRPDRSMTYVDEGEWRIAEPIDD